MSESSYSSSNGREQSGQENPLSSEQLREKYQLHTVTPDLEVPPREWLVDDLIPERAIVFFGGQPKVGKTWLSLDLAISVATGTDFLGRSVKEKGSVVYLLGEDDLGDTLERIDMLLKGRGLDRRALHVRMMLRHESMNLEDLRNRALMLNCSQDLEPALIVFDPLARFLDKAEENSATEMRKITNWLRSLQRETSVTILVVHHTDKEGRGLRGTGEFRALSEATLLLRKTGNAKATTVSVEMRRGRCPDPFDIQLDDGSEGAMRWVVKGDSEAERLDELREILREAGDKGVPISQVQKRLHVRWDTAKELLESSDAVMVGKGRWCFVDMDSLLPQDACGGIVPKFLELENLDSPESGGE